MPGAAYKAVVASFLLCLALIGGALFSAAGMQQAFTANPLETLFGFLLVSLLCSWPWYKAWRLASSEEGGISAWVYAVGTVIVCASFVHPIATAPAEGAGYYTLLCVLLLWIGYPACLLFRRRST